MRPLQSPLQSLPRFVRPRAPRQPPTATRPHPPPSTLRTHPARPYSCTPPKPNPNPNPTNTSTATSPPPPPSQTTRAERILSRLPRPLQRYASRLRGAPVTHVVAFLVLHELTAVVPLVGLFGLFHYNTGAAWAPAPWVLEHYGGYVREGAGQFERYFRRKGWFGFGGEGEEEGGEVGGAGQGGRGGQQQGSGGGIEGDEGEKEVMARWEADPRYRVVVEVALAYAITKALLPVRVVASVWATPWFAGVLTRLKRVVRR